MDLYKIIVTPDAAATFLQWKSINRTVVKGAKAFPIFSPITCKINLMEMQFGDHSYQQQAYEFIKRKRLSRRN